MNGTLTLATVMMPHPLLYTYRRCPYAMRARMALIYAGVGFDAFEIVLRQKPPEMLEISPKGTVPVLLLPDGSVLEQSLDIMRWALAPKDAQGVWSGSQSADNLAMIALNDGSFKQQLDRYKYPDRHADGLGAASRHGALNDMLAKLEQRLQTHLYLGGAQACAADWAIFPFVRQFRAVDVSWFDSLELPATQRWLQSFLESELFALCMKKLPTETRVTF
jgi:glutathione S-transferase